MLAFFTWLLASLGTNPPRRHAGPVPVTAETGPDPPGAPCGRVAQAQADGA